MSIVECPVCSRKYKIAYEMAGRRIRCKQCGEVFSAPDMIIDAEDAARILGETPRAAGKGGGPGSDEIDFKIFGEEMQYCEVALDPGEMVISEAGAMMYMSAGIEMNTVFGDPSSRDDSFWTKVATATKRVLTRESLFMTTFTNIARERECVAFGAPYPGRILPITLSKYGGELICQKDAFLCGARGVEIGIAFQKKLGVGLFGGEGFIMQRLRGTGVVMIHAGGTLMHRELEAGETLRLDTGCLMAMGSSVGYDIETVGGFKNIFGGEGLFLATLTGPGPVWLQSLPFSRLAGRMIRHAPQSNGSKGEGSLFGQIGNMMMGDHD